MSAALPPCGDSERTNSRGDSRMACEKSLMSSRCIFTPKMQSIFTRSTCDGMHGQDDVTRRQQSAAGGCNDVTSDDTDDMK